MEPVIIEAVIVTPVAPTNPKWWATVYDRQVEELARSTGLPERHVRERLRSTALRTPPTKLAPDTYPPLPGFEALFATEPKAAEPPKPAARRRAARGVRFRSRVDARTEAQILARLTGVLEAVGQAFGLGAVEAVVEACGGRLQYIPHVPDGSRLEAKLGRPLLAWFCERYGGTSIQIPTGRAVQLAKRDAEIRQRYDAGESSRSLARAFNLNSRSIFRILGTPEAE